MGLHRLVRGDDQEVGLEGDEGIGGAGEAAPAGRLQVEFEKIEPSRLRLLDDRDGDIGDGQLVVDEREPGFVIAPTNGVASTSAEVAISCGAELPDGEGGAVLDAADASLESRDGTELLEAAEYPRRAACGAAGGRVRPERC